MSDLAAAAAAMGVPEALVKRSARARAPGTSVDDILAAWAGGGEAPSAAASLAAPDEGPKPQASSPPPEPAGVTAAASVEPQTSNLEPQTTVVATAPRTISAPPPPTEVSPKEALRYPVVVTVPTSGLTERIVPPAEVARLDVFLIPFLPSP